MQALPTYGDAGTQRLPSASFQLPVGLAPPTPAPLHLALPRQGARPSSGGVEGWGAGDWALEPWHLLAASIYATPKAATPKADPCTPEPGGWGGKIPGHLFFHFVPSSLGTENFLHPSGSQRKKNIFEKYSSMLILFFVANSPK